MHRPGRVLAALLSAAALAALIPLASASGAGAPVPAARAAADGSGWGASATAFRGRNGERFTFDCPKYGTPGAVWGTDIYTDDSSVCTAAVHVGVISLAGGGTVTIEIRPGEASYTGTTRNRIASSSYPAWSGSYVVVGALPTDPGVGTGGDAWNATASQFRTWVGAQFEYDCPPDGTPGTVWGTNVYTDDSSVCTAAVHGGLITLAKGGKVTIEMRDGEADYRASKRHGIQTNPYGAWGGSFIVVNAPNGPDDPEGVATGDVTVDGRPFTSGRVRYGSLIDVTRGTLRLTAKKVGTILTFGNGTDTARFKLKKIVQKGRKRRVTAELALNGGDFGACAAEGARAAKSSKNVRSLWASGKGRFRTKGRYSTASIRGTKWQTTDRCDGTLTAVEEGTVVVRDLRLRKNVLVRAGDSYLAQVP